MKFPLPWIAQFVELPPDEDAVCEAFTLSGSEVEGRETAGGETVLDFNLTVNRPDCMSVYGLAREASVLFGKPLRPLGAELAESGEAASASASVTVEAADLCPRYVARVVRGVRVGPSPDWMQKRLLQCGLRPVNAAVDITNFVLLEMGHPLHAFDLRRLRGARIVVRRARADEKMLFLDGMERPLTAEHLVIADAERPVALAGVMGGEETGVTSATGDILLEGAVFDPVNIRKTSKAFSLRTDASHRFERGVDPRGPEAALDRCAQLLAEICGGEPAPGRIDVRGALPARPPLKLRHARVTALLGMEVPAERCAAILGGLGFGLSAGPAGEWAVEAPSHRVDIAREADLIEEIARVHGLGGLPHALPQMVDPAGGRPAALRTEERLRDALSASGFRESVHMSMTEPALCRACDAGEEPVALANPLSPAASALRTSLLPPLLGAVARNRARGVRRMALFELGRSYHAREGDPRPREERRAAALLFADDPPARWGAPGEEGLLHLKGRLEDALASAGLAVEFRPADAGCFYPGLGMALEIFGRPAGRAGTLRSGLLDAAGLKSGHLHYAEWSLEGLEEGIPEPRFRPFSKYPAATRDFSFLLPSGEVWERVRGVLEGLGLAHLQSLELVEVYEGKGVPEGKRSWTFSLVFQSPERTLTDEDIAPLAARVAGVMVDALGGVQR